MSTPCILVLTFIVLKSANRMIDKIKINLRSQKPSVSKLAVALLTLNLLGCSVLQTEADRSTDLKPLPTSVSVASHIQTKASGFGGTGDTVDRQATVTELSSLRHPTILDSGFGGTGKTASGFGGTGMVGTLEQFGSIWVNGIEVGIGQKTRISSNLDRASTQVVTAKDLRVGQQVWLETRLDQDKTTTAEVHVFYPLAGKVEAVKVLGMTTEIVVNGQRVLICPQTVMPEDLTLKMGEWVRISGVPVYSRGSLKRNNAWQATLIEPSKQDVSWVESVPDITFSDRVNRVLMHSSWSSAYQAGEFKNIKQGLSAQPKIQVLGTGNSKPVVNE